MTTIFEIISELIGNSSVVLALITMLGLFLQNDSLGNIIKEGFLTFIGFLIMMIGINVIVESIKYLSMIFEYTLGVKGYIADVSSMSGVINKILGPEIALTLSLTMIINIIIARLTKFKFIFLSGQALLWMSTVSISVLYANGIQGGLMITIASLWGGIMAVSMPALCQPIVRRITGNDKIALGHFCSIGYLIQAMIAKIVGDPKRSTEDIELPKRFEFLKNSYLSMSLIIVPLYVVLALFSGENYFQEQEYTGNYLIKSFMESMSFIAGIYILNSGVSLIMDSLIPAFKGIATKLVPDSIPALDCPVFFPYMPNAVILGFLATMLGSVIGVIILPFIGQPIIIPSMLVGFFAGGTAGIFGNAVGGIRGTLIGGIFHGIFITIIPAYMVSLSSFYEIQGITFSDSDVVISGILINGIILSNWKMIIMLAFLLIPFIYIKRKYKI